MAIGRHFKRHGMPWWWTWVRRPSGVLGDFWNLLWVLWLPKEGGLDLSQLSEVVNMEKSELSETLWWIDEKLWLPSGCFLAIQVIVWAFLGFFFTLQIAIILQSLVETWLFIENSCCAEPWRGFIWGTSNFPLAEVSYCNGGPEGSG